MTTFTALIVILTTIGLASLATITCIGTTVTISIIITVVITTIIITATGST
jgi:hypothetical protein